GSTRRDREAAREAHERAIEAARAARSVASPVRWGSSRPDAVEIGASMGLITYHRWTDPAEALRHGTALRARALEAGRPADVGHIDARLGDLASDAGDTDAATMLYDRAIELATRRHDDLHRAHVTLTRAIALVRAGREPLDVIPALIARHREFARATVVAAAELVLGDGLAVSGRWSDAEHAYQRALSLVRVPAAARWRLLRGERVRGRDTRGELEGVFRADRDNWWWDRPDVLGFLVEAAATAEQYGQLDRASRLIAAVVGMRRTFALPTVIAADLAELEQRYRAEPARSALPDHLFNR
ncbi:MAG TPA: hypothetical protein VNA12_10740, partial [Mycobacteriales bacterium]|nr:hypothetical protein [Mycobacteriales bacterium]